MTNRSDDRKCDNATLRSHGARSKFQLDRHATLNVRGGHGGHGAAFLVTRRVARHVLHLSGRTLRGGLHPAGTYARRPTLASPGTLECRRVREISRKWGAHVREAGTAVRPGSSTRGPFDCRATRPNDPGTRAVEIHSCVFPPTPHVARPCLDLHRDQHASC